MNEIRDIHQPFCRWLTERGIPFHRNRPDKKTTAIKGDPDFLLTWCSYCVYIECKVPGGKLSKDQEKRIAYLRKAGNPVKIAYSLQDCIEAAQGILCHGEQKNAVAGRPERSECPLDNERAAELIAAATNKRPKSKKEVAAFFKEVATRTPQGTAYEIPVVRKPDQNLWIASMGGVEFVFSGDSLPGGLATKLRRAKPEDFLSIPRK